MDRNCAGLFGFHFLDFHSVSAIHYHGRGYASPCWKQRRDDDSRCRWRRYGRRYGHDDDIIRKHWRRFVLHGQRSNGTH